MVNHTPGPWRVTDKAGGGYGKQFLIYTPKGAAFTGNQLEPTGTSTGEARANATLAAAAPDLWIALLDIISALDGGEIVHHDDRRITNARTALDKAQE